MEHTQEKGTEVEIASSVFIGRWIRLVSTTNWEKGRIVYEWRQSLINASAPTSEYSDEAWSKRVGGVSGQHAGRLRRVYQRFGQDYEQYRGLYWSHFQAAVDWDDAEMWLEGAVHKNWSVSQMRQQRWEALGLPEDIKPYEDEIVAEESDQDEDDSVAPFDEDQSRQRSTDFDSDSSTRSPEGPDFGEEDFYSDSDDADQDEDSEDATAGRSRGDRSGNNNASDDTFLADPEKAITIAAVRPFSGLAKLPIDVADAFESFKLAILRHKNDQWREVPADDVLAALDGLKQLVLAPSE